MVGKGAVETRRRLDAPFGSGQYAYFTRLGPKGRAVVHRQPTLGLPLMYHLVEKGVLHLTPGVPGYMSPADPYLLRPALVRLHDQLAEAGAHPAGQSDGYRAQSSAEMA
jgi:hypothetical protein